MIQQSFHTNFGIAEVRFIGRDARFEAPEIHLRYGRLLAAFSDIRTLAYAEQVHGSHVAIVGAASSALHSVGEGDALLTTQPHTGLVIRTADCIPILFFSTKDCIAAAVHAGWRGLEKKILSKTVGAALAAKPGAAMGDLRIVIGPSIAEKSYEVGHDVAARFDLRHSIQKPNEKFMLNLNSVLQSEIADLGIVPHQVTSFATDTLGSADWFSARGGDVQRNLSVVWFTARN